MRFRFALHASGGFTAAMVRFSRVSGLPGRHDIREINVDPAQLKKSDLLGTSTPIVQDAFPDPGDDDRESLLNGITPGEWIKLLGLRPTGPARHADFRRFLHRVVASAPIKHFDGTGMQVAGMLCGLHVGSTASDCHFLLGESRGDRHCGA